MSSRITFHQHRARQLLEISAEEEDDLSYGYADTHVWMEGDDGELALIPDEGDNPMFPDPEVRQNPERFSLSMPSHLGLAVCEQRGLSSALHGEIQLRIGQCNDALQAIRLFIGKKAFVFKTNIRSAPSKKYKTRAYRQVQSMDSTLRYHAQLYRRARAALQLLNAPRDVIARFRDLLPVDLKTNTTFLNSSVSGVKHANLAWFWYLDMEGDAVDDSVMKECKCLGFLG